MLNNILVWYLAIALIVFGVWFGLFLKDNSTPNNHLLSWVVLLIAPFFWPIILPISVIELLGKAKAQRRHQTKIKSPHQLAPINPETLETGYHES
ncbi:hypothetical protein Sta7437_0563 [Stanieria cyanosphaera PCC 7437]|uniref:Uncharacterized protein n=1 Tax=Stanieria cyanosphaera (strain ATCC 29371 / PCC 7437) TaxID=111780 RepID=K9XPZ3_STAC7|nr:hypothetical protein [Stanieria cyanosphaera]AFZ34164.1 hypothetical protein Sta7437_0563 [Stanieria cyanosphaera PCC 7437]